MFKKISHNFEVYKNQKCPMVFQKQQPNSTKLVFSQQKSKKINNQTPILSFSAAFLHHPPPTSTRRRFLWPRVALPEPEVRRRRGGRKRGTGVQTYCEGQVGTTRCPTLWRPNTGVIWRDGFFPRENKKGMVMQ